MVQIRGRCLYTGNMQIRIGIFVAVVSSGLQRPLAADFGFRAITHKLKILNNFSINLDRKPICIEH
jgi:hypothetical protein